MEDRGLKINRKKMVYLRFNVYIYMKSSGAKRVMRQNKKNPVFVGFCKQCTSPMLCQNIFPQNEI